MTRIFPPLTHPAARFIYALRLSVVPPRQYSTQKKHKFRIFYTAAISQRSPFSVRFFARSRRTRHMGKRRSVSRHVRVFYVPLILVCVLVAPWQRLNYISGKKAQGRIRLLKGIRIWLRIFLRSIAVFDLRNGLP